MKIRFGVLTIILSFVNSISFAFIIDDFPSAAVVGPTFNKMDGPFYGQVKKIDSLENEIGSYNLSIPKPFEVNILKGHITQYICSHDPNTKITLISQFTELKATLIKYANFLKGNEINFELKNTFNFVFSSFDDLFGDLNLKPNIFFVQCPQNKEDFITSSNVTITHQQENNKYKVFLSKENKKIDFQKVLKGCFYSDQSYDYIVDLITKCDFYKDKENKENKEKELSAQNVYKIKNVAKNLADGVKLPDDQFILLEGSSILTIYGILKDEKDRDSIFWGIAENNQTKEKFHYILNLNNDISVFFNK